MGTRTRRAKAAAAVGSLLLLAPVAQSEAVQAAGPPGAVLVARAVLPADTFADGPPSGALLGAAPVNGRTPPFPAQPVQGFSALVEAGRGEVWAMPDNGYGRQDNSADFLLRVYRVRPDFETRRGGPGTVEVLGWVGLRDPDRRVPWTIVREDQPERALTGADFDIESLRVLPDGTMWIGDEFGPWLLHADATGRLLSAPVPLPGVKAPQNATRAPDEAATLPGSRGFEGMALSVDGRTLYPMLEGALVTEMDKTLRAVYEFDLASGEYTGARWTYRTDDPTHTVPELVALDAHRLLVIERDVRQGAAATFKKVFLVDLHRTAADGTLVKAEVLDLLAIRDPDLISLPAGPGDIGLGDPFSFPYETIEALLPLGGGKVLVANDNNYPFSAGRTPGEPDDNELIVVVVPALGHDGLRS